MKPYVLTYILPAVVGFLAGLIATFIAPWVHWGIEKRRTRQSKRRELIGSCRMLLATDIDRHTFRETEVYSKVRPHLSRSTIDGVEKDTDPGVKGSEGPGFKEKILDELAELEKNWVLI